MKKYFFLLFMVTFSFTSFSDCHDDYYKYKGKDKHLSDGVKEFLATKEKEEGTYIKDIDFERNWKGKKIIEVEIVEKGWEYEYILNPKTGKVLSRKADD